MPNRRRTPQPYSPVRPNTRRSTERLLTPGRTATSRSRSSRPLPPPSRQPPPPSRPPPPARPILAPTREGAPPRTRPRRHLQIQILPAAASSPSRPPPPARPILSPTREGAPPHTRPRCHLQIQILLAASSRSLKFLYPVASSPSPILAPTREEAPPHTPAAPPPPDPDPLGRLLPLSEVPLPGRLLPLGEVPRYLRAMSVLIITWCR